MHSPACCDGTRVRGGGYAPIGAPDERRRRGRGGPTIPQVSMVQGVGEPGELVRALQILLHKPYHRVTAHRFQEGA